MKKALIIGLIILIATVSVYLYNYFTIDKLVQHELNSDERNSGVIFDTHYENYVETDLLIINLKEISGGKTKVDIFRALWQSADALKDEHFKSIKLEYKGDEKFVIPGDYFKELGKEYNSENPMYVIRTFPENILDLNGQQAYESVSGGLLGVLMKEMDNFNDFSKRWYQNSYETQ